MRTFIFICNDEESFSATFAVQSQTVEDACKIFLENLRFDSIERKYAGILDYPEPNESEFSNCDYWLGSFEIYEIHQEFEKLD